MEIHIFGFIGENSDRYKRHVKNMREHNNIVFDLCNTSEEHVVEDMLKCDTIYIIGDYREFNEDVWNCIALASVCGKDLRDMDNLPVSELNKHTVKFLRDLADGLENAYILAKRIGVIG